MQKDKPLLKIKWLVVLSFTAIAVIIAITSKMDKTDQEAERAYYCEMVKQGYWTNYKRINCDARVIEK